MMGSGGSECDEVPKREMMRFENLCAVIKNQRNSVPKGLMGGPRAVRASLDEISSCTSFHVAQGQGSAYKPLPSQSTWSSFPCPD